MNNLKAYILVKENIPLGKAINSVCHAGALITKYYPEKDDPIIQEWWDNLFRKVTCKVTEKEFERAKKYDDWFVVTESSLDNAEVLLVFKPRRDWPKFFKFLQLYK